MQRIAVGAFLLTWTSSLWASTIFDACVETYQRAQRGCGAQDRYTGMQDPKEVDRLLGAIDQYGSFVRKSAACGRMPAHFDNQARMADAVAQLSDLKAGACHVTRTSCRATCSEVAIREGMAADVYQIVGASGKAARARQQAQIAGQNDSECGRFVSHVDQFQTQAANARRNQQEALVGYHRSLQDNVDWSNSNPECQAAVSGGRGSANSQPAQSGSAKISSLSQENSFGSMGTLTQKPVGDEGDSAAPNSSGATATHLLQANVANDAGGSKGKTDSISGSPLPAPKVDAQSLSHFRELSVPKGDVRPQSGHQTQLMGVALGNPQAARGIGRKPAQIQAKDDTSPYPDGITPASGPSIFQKISHQYQRQAHRLLQ